MAHLCVQRLLLPASYFLIPIIPFKRFHYKCGFLYKFSLIILCIIHKFNQKQKCKYFYRLIEKTYCRAMSAHEISKSTHLPFGKCVRFPQSRKAKRSEAERECGNFEIFLNNQL